MSPTPFVPCPSAREIWRYRPTPRRSFAVPHPSPAPSPSPRRRRSPTVDECRTRSPRRVRRCVVRSASSTQSSTQSANAATRTRAIIPGRRVQTAGSGVSAPRTLIARAFAPEPRREFLARGGTGAGAVVEEICRRRRRRGVHRGEREKASSRRSLENTARSPPPRPRSPPRLPYAPRGRFDFSGLSDGGAEFDAFDGAALARQRDARVALRFSCAARSPRCSTRSARLALALEDARGVAVGASEGGPSSGGGGGESRGGGRGAGRRGRHAERQAGVGRTDAIGVLEGPHHDGVGGPGDGRGGVRHGGEGHLLDRARASDRGRRGDHSAEGGRGVGGEGGQRAPGRGRTGVPPGGGFRGTGRGDGFGGKGRRTWPFDVRARSLEPFVRHARREGGRTRRRARRCARSTRPARSRFSRQKSAAPRLRESMRMRTATLSNKGVFVLETSSESARVRRLRLTSERRVVSRVGDRPLGDARDTGPRAAETM